MRYKQIALLLVCGLTLVGCGRSEEDEGPTYAEIMAEEALLEEQAQEEDGEPNVQSLRNYFDQVVHTYLPNNVEQASLERQQEMVDEGAVEEDIAQAREINRKEGEDAPEELYEVNKYEYDPELVVTEGEELTRLMPEYYRYPEGTLLLTPEQSASTIHTHEGQIAIQNIRFDMASKKLIISITVTNTQGWVVNPIAALTVYNDTQELASDLSTLPLVQPHTSETINITYDITTVSDLSKVAVHVQHDVEEIEAFSYSLDELNIYTYQYGIRVVREGLEQEAAQYEQQQEQQILNEVEQAMDAQEQTFMEEEVVE